LNALGFGADVIGLEGGGLRGADQDDGTVGRVIEDGRGHGVGRLDRAVGRGGGAGFGRGGRLHDLGERVGIAPLPPGCVA